MSTAPKTALITGGASGIGLSMARHFAAEGYNVAVLDVNAEGGEHAIANDIIPVVAKRGAEVGKPKAVFKKCDVSSWQSQADAFKAVYAEFGRIDVVCANAGIGEGSQGKSALAMVEEGDGEEPQEPGLRILNVNLDGVVYSVKLAIHYMNKNQPSSNGSRGSIITTASNAGLYPFPVSPIYAAAKAGVIALVRSMARILEPRKIQINALAPAVLVTNIAPSQSLFDGMIVTPHSTLVEGVVQLVSDPALSGQVAEIHGERVTFRPPYEFVDEDSKKNLEHFWSLAQACVSV
ncbi:hypothetical protein BD289DRAFT_479638 [Coniella lustricola]|uniref:Short chain dehydrogenase/reductase n=1 Tax=Coniella lustricola TaxID=2025994 RepID=A0A2T3AIK3_9PEZI|nr:hypothetical protein BD289DRAFT_479638 [Coniella lustricola]